MLIFLQNSLQDPPNLSTALSQSCYLSHSFQNINPCIHFLMLCNKTLHTLMGSDKTLSSCGFCGIGIQGHLRAEALALDVGRSPEVTALVGGLSFQGGQLIW